MKHNFPTYNNKELVRQKTRLYRKTEKHIEELKQQLEEYKQLKEETNNDVKTS